MSEPVAWMKDGHIFTIYPEFMKKDATPLYAAPPQDALDGMVMVPREPTNAMAKAGAIVLHGESGRLGAGWGASSQIYRAMIDAALSAQTKPGEAGWLSNNEQESAMFIWAC